MQMKQCLPAELIRNEKTFTNRSWLLVIIIMFRETQGFLFRQPMSKDLKRIGL